MNEIEWSVRRSCVYNGGVDCERTFPCRRCGWRPDVGRRRVCEIRRALREAAAGQSDGPGAKGGVCV